MERQHKCRRTRGRLTRLLDLRIAQIVEFLQQNRRFALARNGIPRALRVYRRATGWRRPAFISVSRRSDEKEIARNSGGWRADLVSWPRPAFAQTPADLKVGMDTVWVLITASLVFFMNLGFALVESGFCRAKNTVNILSKNFIVFAISCLAFYVFGWGLMFGNGTGFIGLEGLFMLGGADNSPATGDAYVGAYKSIAWTGVPLNAKFFFQLVFAGTAATIVSGAVAERIKYLSFIVFSFLLVAFVYPITGHWIWGGGFLATAGFWDFAGSTVVHSVGGWAALAGILILGPRLGKYGPDGKVNAIPPHSFTSGVIGCFVLWLGWFGFNPGSTMAVDANAIAHIFMTTNTAAFMGLLSATALNWIVGGQA